MFPKLGVAHSTPRGFLSFPLFLPISGGMFSTLKVPFLIQYALWIALVIGNSLSLLHNQPQCVLDMNFKTPDLNYVTCFSSKWCVNFSTSWFLLRGRGLSLHLITLQSVRVTSHICLMECIKLRFFHVVNSWIFVVGLGRNGNIELCCPLPASIWLLIVPLCHLWENPWYGITYSPAMHLIGS